MSVRLLLILVIVILALLVIAMLGMRNRGPRVTTIERRVERDDSGEDSDA